MKKTIRSLVNKAICAAFVVLGAFAASADLVKTPIYNANNVSVGYMVTGLDYGTGFGNEVAMVYTNHNTDANCEWTVPANLKNVEFLVVGGGGGGGGGTWGPGGGGGGVITGSFLALNQNDELMVSVGKGGDGAPGNTTSTKAEHGTSSKVEIYNAEDYILAYGGGGGRQTAKGTEGSGAGGPAGSKAGVYYAGRVGYGGKVENSKGLMVDVEIRGKNGGASNVYGSSSAANQHGSGGGGGATAVGADSTGGGTSSGKGGNGGQGLASSITGQSVVYGSGGGAGGYTNNYTSSGKGGEGAGNGASNANSNNTTQNDVYATSALANQGGGGGGGGKNNGVAYRKGGNGGSGIVVFRYAYNFKAGDNFYFDFASAADNVVENGTIQILNSDETSGSLNKSVTLQLADGVSYTGTITLAAADAVLTAPEGLNVVTTVANSEVKFENGAYTVVEAVVTISLPNIDNATWKYNDETVTGSITVNKGTAVELTLNAADGYQFANGETLVKVTFDSVNENIAADNSVFNNIAAPQQPVVAKIGDVTYATLEAAFAAATEGQTITLLQDAAPALTSQRAITKAAVIDLGGKTLTLMEDDLYFGTTTFQNGTIVVDPSVKPSTAVFWMFANQTLTFDAVKIVATGVTGTYLIGLDGNNADLNLLNGSEILVENTTALDLDIVCVNASTGNDIVIDNSKVNVTNLDGKVLFRGNYTIKGNSEINLDGITKAGIRIEAGQTLSIEDTASVTITGEPRDGGIHLTDATATYTKADTATVTATVNAPYVAQIGTVKYMTLADAVAAAESGDTIVLKAGEYELPLFANKELTFKGESKEGVIINDAPDARAQGWNGSTFHFENLTAKGATANYHGLANGVVAVTYKDCIIKGLRFLYANEVSFETCEFNAEGVEHSFWTYGSPKVTVSNCSFSYTDRAVNCYSENGAEHELDIAFTDCTFTYAGSADAPEGAVEINSGSVKSIELAMDNCTAPEKGAMWYNSQWDSKKGENTAVSVNGESVWPLVAEVNGVQYADLQEAIKAAAPAGTVKLLKDVVVDEWKMVTEDYNIASGELITLTMNGLTIDGNGKKLTVNAIESAGNGGYLFQGATSLTVKNLTINVAEGLVGGIALKAGTIENVTFNGGKYAVLPGSGDVIVKDCTFNGITGYAVYFEEDRDNLEITGNTFNCADGAYAVTLRGAADFTNNTVVKGRVNLANSAKGEVSGNDFGTERFKVYNGATATIENNTINNLVFNDDTAVGSSFANNTFSDEAEAVYLGAFAVAQIGDVKYLTLAEAINAAKAGDTVKVFAGTYAVPSMKAGITIEGAINADGTPAVLFEGTLSGTLENLTMKNIHIRGGNAQRWAYAKGNLNFENVIFEATSVYAIHFDGITEGSTLLYKDCTIIGWAAMSGSPESCVFDGCTIKDNGTYGLIRAYFDTTIKDCTFDVANANTTDVYQDGIHAVNGAEFTVDGCTNANGDMKDLVNVNANSVVILDGVTIKNVAKIGDSYYATLAEALAAAQGSENIVIDLLADATLDITAWETLAIGGDATKTITINGNGNTLTFNKLNSDWNHIVTKNDAKLILNDMTITDSGYNNGPWNRYDINFACDVELNNVTSTKALAFKADATLNDVAVTETNDAYAIWIQPNGQNVVIDGLTVDSAGRGIKIDEQYVDAASKVELSVKDATFTTAKKAAIVVKSAAGADITLENVDISGVAADNVNAVWNDEDSSAVYGNITVTGGTLAQEGVANFVATVGKDDQISAYYSDLHAAMVAAKAGDTVKLIADVDLAGKTWEPVSFKGAFDGQNKIISNLTINKPGVSNTGFITSLNGSFKNVIFTNPTVTGGENTGVVAGRAGGSAALAENITINGTIKVETTHSGYARAGGIVGGWGYGNYKNITVDGGDASVSYIKHTGGGDGRYVAGIVGHADDVDSYENCVVKNITISGGWLCGGIAGPGPSDGVATGCAVENIKMNADYSGGMFGWYFGNGTIEDSSIKNVEFTDGTSCNGAIGGYSANPDANVDNVVVENVVNGGKPLLEHVVAIGTTYYMSLQAAVDAAQDGETVALIADVNESIVVAGKAVTLDLNGKTVSGVEGSYDTVYIEDAGLTVQDSGNTGKIVCKDGPIYDAVCLGPNANFTLNGGTLESDKDDVIYVDGSGSSVAIINGTINGSNALTAWNGASTISGGVITGKLLVQESATLSVTGGTFTVDPSEFAAYGYGATDNGDGTWTVGEMAKNIFIGETAYLTLDEAFKAATENAVIEIKAAGEYIWPATAIPAGVTVKGAVDGVVATTDGKTIINATTLTVENIDFAAHNYAAFISNPATTAITFTDCSFTPSSPELYAICVDTAAEDAVFTFNDCVFNGFATFTSKVGTLDVNGGEINAGFVVRQDATIDDVEFAEDARVQLGTTDTVTDVNVTITGCTVADTNGDGNVPAVKDLVNETNTAIGSGNVVIVDGDVIYGAVAKIGEVEYLTLKAAFDAVNDGETITLLDNVTYTKATGVINGAYVDGLVYTGDKSFTVDFAGYTITENGEINDYLVYFKNTGSKDNEITFINGTVTINAQSSNTAWAAITLGSNSAKHKTTLNLKGMNVVNGNPNYAANQVIRVRNGCIVNINDGTVVTSNGTSYGVVAETGSTVNINDGAKVVQTDSKTTEGNLVYTAVSGNGTINVYDGAEIVSDKYGIHNMTSGNTVVNIYGGSITAPVAVRAATNGGNGESAIVNIFGGTLAGALETYTDAADIAITGGSFSVDPTDYVVDGYAALPNLNDQYVVGVKPTATVNNLGAMTIPEDDYIVYGGSKSGDMPLSFVMQFLADQTEEDMKTSPFADWYGDFVITFTGIENGSFTADGCYLAGHYGDFGWVKVPVDGMTIENGARYPVMLGVGLGQKYDYICSGVEDFKCAMFLTPEIIEANPNLKVKLELAVVDNSQGSDSAASALVNNDKVFSVTEYEYGAEAFAPTLPTATVTPIEAPEGTPLTFALNFKADEVTDAQLAYYGAWYADFVLTITGLPEEGVTFNANGTADGTADGYLAGQYDAWSENWVSVPFEDVTLRNGESIKIMEYAATLMGQSGLKLTYNDVYSFVKDFNCGVYFTPEFLAANPDMKVSLSLRMYKTGDATDEGVAIGEMEQFSAPAVVAKIGSTPYATLEAAIAAAQAGETITLLKNVGTDAAIQVAKKVTIDLNGKTIATTQNDKSGDGVFHVVAGGDLTIEDGSADKTGTINGVGGNNYNISVWADGGKVTINGGNFTNVGATDENGNNHFDLIYAKNGGVVVINGGKFECESPAWTLNIHDGSRQNSSITVNGGTFVGFDPRNNAAETAGTTFMAPGKYTLVEGGSYSVVTPTDYILNGAASDAAAVDPIDAALAGAVTVTKNGDKITATATYTFKVTAVDTVNPEKSEYELTGGTLRPGKSVKVKYIDLENGGATLTEKPASGSVIFKLVID